MLAPPALSVILCTRDPYPARLARTLDSLRAQTLPLERWELLLIDNESREPLAVRFDLAWHPRARSFRVGPAGKVYGMLRGFAEAAAPVFVMVDDDNVLAPDYLERVGAAFEANPRLGAVTGRVTGEYEGEPGPDVLRYVDRLAITDRGDRPLWSLVPGTRGVRCVGLGMGFRREVGEAWAREATRDARHLLLTRRGANLVGGQDIDLAASAFDLGLACAYRPELRLTHLIPRERLAPDYLVRLHRANVYAEQFGLLLRGLVEPRRPCPLWLRAARRAGRELVALAMRAAGRWSALDRRMSAAEDDGYFAAHADFLASGVGPAPRPPAAPPRAPAMALEAREARVSVVTAVRDPRTLRAIEGQTLPRDRWEAVEELARARGDVVVLVGEGDVLAPDYLERLVAIFDANPDVGVVSGRVIAECEAPPSPWARRYLDALHVRDEGDRPLFADLPGFEGVACGGPGTAARRALVERHLERARRDRGRRRVPDDLGVALCAFELGLAKAYFPELVVTRRLPARRLRPGRILAAIRARAYEAEIALLARGVHAAPEPLAAPLRALRDLHLVVSALARTLIRGGDVLDYRAARERDRGAIAAQEDFARGPQRI